MTKKENSVRKIVYEKESDSEPEVDESENVPEKTEKEIEKPKIGKKQPAQKSKNNIFECLNNNSKRNKR